MFSSRPGNTETFTFQVSEGAGGAEELMLTDTEGTAIGPYQRQ